MEKKQIVTPWVVKGNVDYDKLINDFGVKKIDSKLLERIEKHAKVKGEKLHRFLRRNIFFAHRDLEFILDEFDKGNKFFLYTGRAPSGKTHIGHIVPWMFTKWLQDIFDVELWFQFPDEEKFLFKKKLSYQDVQKALEENMLDVIAVGFNNKKTKFLIDTRHANLMFKEAIKVSKHITLSTAKGIFGFTNDTNIGAIFYTSMQAVPAFLPSILENKNIPCLIPYAIDQDPHFRASRDVIPKLGYYKPASIEGIFLPGLKGMESDGKMSSSDLDNSTIYVSDDPETVKRKINKYAYSGGQPTIEEHRRLGGNPDIDVSYQWLRFFEEDDEKLKEIYNDYKKGKLLSGEIKKLAIESINTYLKELQKRREDSSKLLPKFLEWYEAYR